MSAGPGHGTGPSSLRKQTSLSHSGALSSFGGGRARPWEGWGVSVCVVSGVGGEKGLLALRSWIYKGLSEDMMSPGGRKIK